MRMAIVFYLHRFHMLHKPREVAEIPSISIELVRRTINDNALLDFDRANRIHIPAAEIGSAHAEGTIEQAMAESAAGDERASNRGKDQARPTSTR